jgi:hypothetical protein
MPPLSWNEIKDRALAFSREWAKESSEDAEAKSFWDAFFNVFGVTRRRLASFEQPVKQPSGHTGYIDLLWKGVILVEHKSRGKDLDRAYKQATDYFSGLSERELPKYVLVSDFARFRLYDLETGEQHEFPLADLHKNVRRFGFMAGYLKQAIKPEDPINVEAVERLGKLHDALAATGYTGHPLEILLVRLLFSLFADDTGIFEKNSFQEFITTRTGEDGSDLGSRLSEFFYYLNQPEEGRPTTLDETIKAFPYVNGHLFEEFLPPAAFTRAMRDALLDCCALDWSRISPAIFGSLFQSVMDKQKRRELGAHYTTETNILKLIQPLFLDGLWKEFEAAKNSKPKLEALHEKLANLRFLDPACGCGNFLVIAYRELRGLELEILKKLHAGKESGFLDVKNLAWVDVDQFYGIELEEFPARIAEVAMWLMDHQMNLALSEEFGQYFRRLPLKKAATIVNGNALRIDWKTVVKPEKLNFILGNPPFGGSKVQSDEQRNEMETVFHGLDGARLLDYVSAWYLKSAEMMAINPNINAALVSTNSITQGEQVGILWNELLRRKIKIQFAHRTFQWSSEARGKAAVYCVIIGFSLDGSSGSASRFIYDYETPKSEPHVIEAKSINPYLVDAPDVFLISRSTPICVVPEIKFGNMPNDGGYLLLDEEAKDALLNEEPGAKEFVRKFVGADDLLNGYNRYCLWLQGAPPQDIKKLKLVMERVERVKHYRLASTRAATKKLAEAPALFGEIRQPATNYIAIPRHSSENRKIIPFQFYGPKTIIGDSCLFIKDAALYHFAVLQSSMHMAWVGAVCGRLESRYRYSNLIVYNNYPWPENPTDAAKKKIEQAAQSVLDARAAHKGASLADLYDPLTMPPDLLKAHKSLDAAVDAAYGKRNFRHDAERVAFLFELYRKYTSLLPAHGTPTAKRKSGKKRSA